MATFVEQVREMGFKQAAIAKLDDVVERVTAGMNINDVRGMLRGDEPRRPNPRLTPHADSFWLHIRPSFYHTEVTHIYPTFRLGWLSTFMFVWETITGIFLMIFYTPSPNVAYQDIWNILGNVPLGEFMRNLHRWGAEVMVLVVALHMLRTYITGSYKKPRQFTWLTGMFLLVFTLVLSFSGYLLPWDQLAYWAVTVAVSAAESSPGPEFVGKNINLLLRGAPSIGAGGLLRFYLLHVLVLPILLGIFLAVHYYKVIIHGHSLPPGREAVGEDTAKRVPRNERVYFLPDILTNEMMWTALTTLMLVAAVVFFYNAPLERQANPTVTPLHVVAPWYLAWSQGWLKLKFVIPIIQQELDSKVVVAFAFIPLLAISFFVFPYVEVAKSRRYADRRVALLVMTGFVAFMWVSNWMGSPEFLVESSPDEEVFQEILPQEGESILLEVPFDELEKGVFHPGEEFDDLPHLSEALHELGLAVYNHACTIPGNEIRANAALNLTECEESGEGGELVRYGNHFTDNAMPDPDITLTIEEMPGQPSMKVLILRAEVENPNDPDGPLLFENQRIGYRHELSGYDR